MKRQYNRPRGKWIIKMPWWAFGLSMLHRKMTSGENPQSGNFIFIAIVLTPFMFILRGGGVLGVILLWCVCGWAALKSMTKNEEEMEESADSLRAKYANNPGAYDPPAWLCRTDVIEFRKRRNGVRVPEIYERDRYVLLATQQIAKSIAHRNNIPNLDKVIYKEALSQIDTFYHIDNYGIWREGVSWELAPEERANGIRKRAYIASCPSNFGYVKGLAPTWARNVFSTKVVWSSWRDYYDPYKYDPKEKISRKVPGRTRSNKSEEASRKSMAEYI